MAANSGDPATAVSVRGFQVLKIDGYSRTLNAPCGVSCFRSYPFRVGGRTWDISYYPKGNRRTNTDFFSISLLLVDADDASEAVAAQPTFSLLDQDQKPVPSYSRTATMSNFSASNRCFGYEKFMRRETLERSGHLIDDCFSVRVDVHVHVVKEAPSSMLVPPSDMHLHIGDLLSSEEGADLEFRVGSNTFRAHRLVLSARSSVFRAALFDPATKVIHVEDMEAPVFRALLTFIYTDALLEMDPEDEYAMTQHLLVAADRYSLQRLKLICQDRLCDRIDPSSVATMLVLAARYHCPFLKEACFEFLSSSKFLFDVVETEGFKYLAQSFPVVVKELIADFLTRCLEKASISWWDDGGQSSSENGADNVGFRVTHQLLVPDEHSLTPMEEDIEPMEAQVSREFLTFIYMNALREVDPNDEYAITQHLLVVADKHSLQRLKLICEDILRDHINTSSMTSLLALAVKYHCPRLKEACMEFLSSSKILFDFIETEDFEHLVHSFPTITKELIANVLAHGLDKASNSRWDQDCQLISVIKANNE